MLEGWLIVSDAVDALQVVITVSSIAVWYVSLPFSVDVHDEVEFDWMLLSPNHIAQGAFFADSWSKVVQHPYHSVLFDDCKADNSDDTSPSLWQFDQGETVASALLLSSITTGLRLLEEELMLKGKMRHGILGEEGRVRSPSFGRGQGKWIPRGAPKAWRQ